MDYETFAGTRYDFVLLSFFARLQSDFHTGIKLEQSFSKKSTHLLCPSCTGLKFDKARDWNTPVVTVQWLAHIATTGIIPPVSEFAVPLAQTAGSSKQENVMDIDLVDNMNKIQVLDQGQESLPIKEPVTESVSKEVSGEFFLSLR